MTLVTSLTTGGSFYRAVITIVVAIFLFDVQAALIKHMGTRFSIEQIAVFRNFFGLFPHFIVLLLMAEWRSAGYSLKMKRWKLGLGRGVLLICAQMAFYYALTHLELATAATLAFSGPLFVTILSIPLLGHRVGWWRTSAVVLGFIGVVLVMRPGSDTFTAVALFPIAAAFFYALASLSSRFFDDDISTALISIYATTGALISAFLVLVTVGQWTPMTQLTDWLWFMAMGTVGGMAVFLLISAYRMSDPSSLSPFEYFGIPFSFLLGWFFFGEVPIDSLFPGVLLIVGGGLLVVWRERKVRSKKTPQES